MLASHWTLKRVGGVCFVVVVPRVVVSVVVVPRAVVVFAVVPRAVVFVVARDQLRAAHFSEDAMDHAV